MRLLSALAVAAAALPFSVQAQEISECGWVANPANILEPWSEFSRSFANGAIRIAVLDTAGEPVCCATHLLIIAPSAPDNGPVYRQCFVASARGSMGFYDIDFKGITASYDPARGLLLSVPVSYYHDGVGTGAPGIPDQIEIRIDQLTGTVVTE